MEWGGQSRKKPHDTLWHPLSRLTRTLAAIVKGSDDTQEMWFPTSKGGYLVSEIKLLYLSVGTLTPIWLLPLMNPFQILSVQFVQAQIVQVIMQHVTSLNNYFPRGWNGFSFTLHCLQTLSTCGSKHTHPSVVHSVWYVCYFVIISLYMHIFCRSKRSICIF